MLELNVVEIQAISGGIEENAQYRAGYVLGEAVQWTFLHCTIPGIIYTLLT